MKTILIVEHDITELETLMGICRLSSREFTILSARDEESTHIILAEKRVDLIICSTAFPNRQDCLVLARLAQSYPYIPFIAITPSDTIARKRVLAFGISALFVKPFEDASLLEQVHELSESSSTGTVRGIPIHSFLQMLESEEKSCTLQVFSDHNIGLIFIKEGNIIDAETNSLSAEKALYEIISWDEVIIEIKFFNGQRENVINKPLISLIMEGFRLKDEREAEKKKEQTIVKPQHKLKQIATAGHRLALDIGLELKMEFDAIDSSLESILIGLIPGNCIITSTPTHFIVTRTSVAVDSVVLIKYMYMGRLCLFKSKLLKTIDTPQHMLFLDYPAVIHYQEMRRAKRAAIYVPCTLNLPDGRQYFGAFIDLSGTGGLCQIKTKGNKNSPKIEIGQNIEIHCLLPGLMEEQHIKGVIRNFKRNSQESRVGIEFSSLHTHLKETIDRYLYTDENINVFEPMEIEGI